MPTNPCSPGASEVQPGVPEIVAITATAAESFIVLLGQEELAALLAPLVVAAPFNTITFCQDAPPDDPNLTATDITDALDFTNPATSFPAIQKISDWFYRQYWYKICQCATPPTPAAPTPSNPGVTSGTNPNISSGGTLAPCYTSNGTFSLAQASSPGGITTTDLHSLLPGTQSGTATEPLPAGSVVLPKFPVPANATYVSIAATISSNPANPYAVDCDFGWFTSANAYISDYFGPSFTHTGSLTQSASPGAIPTNAAYMVLYLANLGDNTQSFTEQVQINFYCGNPNALQAPCCPPDPLITGLLQQILAVTEATYEALPTPLTGYTTGTVHSGLTGTGSVTLSAKCIAATVAITTDQPAWGSETAEPPFLFDRGYITAMQSSGTVHNRERLVYATQLYLLPPLTAQIGYSLNVGVTASITELLGVPASSTVGLALRAT